MLIVHVILRFNVPREIPLVFHNRSNDYHFIIKKLAIKFEEQFDRLGENRENHETVSIPIENEIRKVDKVGKENIIIISYKIKCIDSAIEIKCIQIHKIKCKGCDFFS